MDANVRVRIVPDEDYDPSDQDRPADETAETVWLSGTGELCAVGAIAERQCPRCGGWNRTGSLWGIEILTGEGFGPGDVITLADIPLGPADPRRLYGYRDLTTVPANLAVPATASHSHLIHIAADLLTEAADAPPR